MDSLGRLFFFIIIIPSAIIHEYMHGWVADQLGDSTARYAGRLTLDPRAHVDLWGTFLLPFMLFIGSGGNFLFAYAKPVPYNPYNLKDQRWGPVLVALAGPGSNFVLAAIFGLILQFMPLSTSAAALVSIVVYANVLLAVFNLVPIPPLDGSKLLFAVLPDSMHNVKVQLERYGFMLLLIFIFFFFELISPFIFFFYNLFTGGVGIFLYDPMSIKVAARAIIIDNGEILLVKHRGSSFYALPGGKRDPGESLRATLVRELEEEFGVSGAIVGEVMCINEFEYDGKADGYSLELFFRIANPEIFRDCTVGSHTEAELADVCWVKDISSLSLQPAQFVPLYQEIQQGIPVVGRYLTQIGTGIDKNS